MSRDPFEGTMSRPMSMNGYSWVEGNVVNAVDPSGLSCEGGVGTLCDDMGGGGGGGILLLLYVLYRAATAPPPGPGGITNDPFLEELAEEFNDGLCDARDGLLSLFSDTSSSDAHTNTDTAENVQEDEDREDDETAKDLALGLQGTVSIFDNDPRAMVEKFAANLRDTVQNDIYWYSQWHNVGLSDVPLDGTISKSEFGRVFDTIAIPNSEKIHFNLARLCT